MEHPGARFGEPTGELLYRLVEAAALEVECEQRLSEFASKPRCQSRPAARSTESKDHRGIGIPDVEFRAMVVRVRVGFDEAVVALRNRAVLGSPPARDPPARRQTQLDGDVEGRSISARLATRYDLLHHAVSRRGVLLGGLQTTRIAYSRRMSHSERSR